MGWTGASTYGEELAGGASGLVAQALAESQSQKLMRIFWNRARSSKFLSPLPRAEVRWIARAYSWVQWRMLDPGSSPSREWFLEFRLRQLEEKTCCRRETY